METRKIVYGIMRVANYVLAIIGCFLVLGAVGGHENDDLTAGQFWMWEIIAFAMIFASVKLYNIRENFKRIYMKRRMR